MVEQFSSLGSGTEAFSCLKVNITQRRGHNRLGCDELNLAIIIMVYVIACFASICCMLAL